jgi:hypothetical protein
MVNALLGSAGGSGSGPARHPRDLPRCEHGGEQGGRERGAGPAHVTFFVSPLPLCAQDVVTIAVLDHLQVAPLLPYLFGACTIVDGSTLIPPPASQGMGVTSGEVLRVHHESIAYAHAQPYL